MTDILDTVLATNSAVATLTETVATLVTAVAALTTVDLAPVLAALADIRAIVGPAPEVAPALALSADAPAADTTTA